MYMPRCSRSWLFLSLLMQHSMLSVVQCTCSESTSRHTLTSMPDRIWTSQTNSPTSASHDWSGIFILRTFLKLRECSFIVPPNAHSLFRGSFYRVNQHFDEAGDELLKYFFIRG